MDRCAPRLYDHATTPSLNARSERLSPCYISSNPPLPFHERRYYNNIIRFNRGNSGNCGKVETLILVLLLLLHCRVRRRRRWRVACVNYTTARCWHTWHTSDDDFTTTATTVIIIILNTRAES